jgi:hypothetical protein
MLDGRPGRRDHGGGAFNAFYERLRPRELADRLYVGESVN